MTVKVCGTCEHRLRPSAQDPCCYCSTVWIGVTPVMSHWSPKMANVPSPDDAGPAVQAVRPDGRKDDSGKLDVTLFFSDLPYAIEGVTEVLQWAITKKGPKPYVRGSWQGVDDFQRRYKGAQLRHELNRSKAFIADPGHAYGEFGVEPTDAETGLLELAHIATDAMFRLEMALRKAKGIAVPEGA